MEPKLRDQAAKKGLKHTANIYKRTRLGVDLTPEDPSMAKFNLKNLSLAASVNQMKYMCQEFAKLVDAQFDKMELAMNQKAEVVAALLKNFQKTGVFAAADTAIFTQEPNLVIFHVF